MRVLLLAPHPLLVERGTPIDVLLVLRVLSERPDSHVDVITYDEGTDIDLPQVTVHRIRQPRVTRGTAPGFSLKKVINDTLLLREAWSFVRRGRYDLIHAGEESVYMALLFKRWFGVPYVYDMDSSIAQQMIESRPYLRPVFPLFDRLETLAVRHSTACLPVCNALAGLCERKGAKRIETLHDISQLKDPGQERTGWLSRDLGLPPGSLIILYSGNLESYQGVDLLVRGFALASKADERLRLVVVGGASRDIGWYRRLADRLGVGDRAHFLGTWPFDQLDRVLAESDIVACPRSRGINTPMKIFPYLHSGTALLATRLHTHTQLLTDEHAYLAEASPEGIARGLLELAGSEALRRRLGAAGRRLVEANHTFAAHRERVLRVYDWLEREVCARPSNSATAEHPSSL
jgi:glycosyltransferase involved in cell wall biosynthesis